MITFDKAAVIGTRLKVLQIAETISSAGINVLLCGESQEQIEESLKEIGEDIDKEIQRWGLTESDKRAILGRITTTTTELKDVCGYEVIVEASGVDLPRKQDILRQIEEMHIKTVKLYITSISVLSVTEIAANSKISDRLIGMHFLVPVPKTPVVELVRGINTSNETVELAKAFSKRLGKTSVEVFESPGYITSRVILPMLNEAMYALMEGISSAEDIDTAIKLGFNFPMGPLGLADHMGLDEVLRRLDNLFNELGDLKYRPCPLLKKMVRAGRLGVKTGEGFFKYNAKPR